MRLLMTLMHNFLLLTCNCIKYTHETAEKIRCAVILLCQIIFGDTLLLSDGNIFFWYLFIMTKNMHFWQHDPSISVPRIETGSILYSFSNIECTFHLSVIINIFIR